MRFVYFTHSLASCWNHGNAHFLRGVLRELVAARPRRHRARARRAPGAARTCSPTPARAAADAWQAALSRADSHGLSARCRPGRPGRRRRRRPRPRVERARPGRPARRAPPRRRAVHAAVPRHAPPRRQRPGGHARLRPRRLRRRARLRRDAGRGLSRLGLGRPRLRLARGRRHRACSTRPPTEAAREGAVWIGNWGDGERTAELESFLLAPTAALGLPLDIHGVRYPDDGAAPCSPATARTTAAGCPTTARPRSSPEHLLTIHVPRRFYADAAARHPDHPRVRGAGLRHPARLGAVAGRARACSPPARTTSSPRTARRCGRHLAALAQRARAPRRPRRARPGHDPRPPHLRAPGRRAARHRRDGLRRLMRIAFYGSSLLSSYWNGAATYYRGLLSALAPLGHEITFYEPDAFDRQSHRDIEPPDYARVVVYPATADGLALGARPKPRRPTSSSRPAASACSTTSCSPASWPTPGPARCASSGTSTPPPRWTRCAPTRPTRSAPRCRSSTSS